jgi:hypothetical protein
MERQIPSDTRRNYGTIYKVLGSHDAVDALVFEMSMAYRFPGNHAPTLVSLAEYLFERGSLSEKQVRYAYRLIHLGR